MPSDDLVVSDTSPLLNLALIDRLDLLDAQFDTIHTPERVWEELEGNDDEEYLRGLETLRDRDTLTLVSVARSALFIEIERNLDSGETAAITYAIETDADLVLLDESDGRRVARQHDLDVTGVLGILLRGVRDGTVELRQELDSLRDVGFWIGDDLYDEVLRRGEAIDR